MAEPAHPTHDLLTLHFGGLCAMVADAPTNATQALLVAAEHSSVRPRLCLHTSLLVFRAADLAGLVGGAAHATFVDGSGAVQCAFDLTGCDVEILPDGLDPEEYNPHGVEPISTDASYEQVLDLRPFASAVDRHWIDGGLHPEGLVSARFKLSHGVLGCPQITKKPWQMVLPGAPDPDSGSRLGQIVRYTLKGQTRDELQYTELRMTNARTGGLQVLRFRPGATLGVSSLCTFDAVQVQDERDVFAYYDLCVEQLPLARRHRPVIATEDKLPGQSACPPVRLGT